MNPTEKKSIPFIDLKDPNTFNRKKINGEQAKERLEILNEVLKEKGTLTPRSLKEREILHKIFSEDEKSDLCKITRQGEGQFYQIEFNKDPIKFQIEKFNQLSHKINAIKTHIMNHPLTNILECLICPPKELEGYTTNVLIKPHSEFLDAQKYAYRANLQLLQAAQVFGEQITLFTLHKKSFDLYQALIDCNRQCEYGLLDYSKKTFQTLVGIRDAILTHCGDKLQNNPEEFLTICKKSIEFQLENDNAIFIHVSNLWKHLLNSLSTFEEAVNNSIKDVNREIDLVSHPKVLEVDIRTVESKSEYLKKNVRSLTEVLCVLIDLLMAVKLRIIEVQKGMKGLSFQNVKLQLIKNGKDAIEVLEGMLGKLFKGHALWLESHTHSFTLKAIQEKENQIKNNLIEGQANAIKDEFQSIEKSLIFNKFATLDELLEKIKEALEV